MRVESISKVEQSNNCTNYGIYIKFRHYEFIDTYTYVEVNLDDTKHYFKIIEVEFKSLASGYEYTALSTDLHHVKFDIKELYDSKLGIVS